MCGVTVMQCKATKVYVFLMLYFPIVNLIQELFDKATDIMMDVHLTHRNK
jgi:hypothetical protein